MRLTINGKEKELQSSRNVQDLLQELEITEPHVAVALNLQVIPRSNYTDTALKDGDKIEIVHAVARMPSTR